MKNCKKYCNENCEIISKKKREKLNEKIVSMNYSN